jgi:hypothetical protein
MAGAWSAVNEFRERIERIGAAGSPELIRVEIEVYFSTFVLNLQGLFIS